METKMLIYIDATNPDIVSRSKPGFNWLYQKSVKISFLKV